MKSKLILDQSTVDVLKKYFKFDKIFYLLDYSYDMARLYADLQALKQESYEHNYRFIFLHYDVEYYITNDIPGILLLNLQKILADLDISNHFCLILTHQQLSSQLTWLHENTTTDAVKIDSLPYYNYFFVQQLNNSVDPDIEINKQCIDSKYISLNRVVRFHRTVLFSLLQKKNILDQGMVSFNSL